MMTRLRALQDDSGVAMIIAISVLATLLLLTGVVVSVSTHLNSSSKRDRYEKRAFEAAQAGLQTTLYRLNMLSNSSGQSALTVQEECIGTKEGGSAEELVKPTLPAGTPTVCAPFSESLGNGVFYTSWTSKVVDTASSCAGSQVGTSKYVAERCVTAQGTVCPPSYSTATCPNPVIHRVQERVASFSGKPVFPYAGILVQRGIQLENKSWVHGSIYTAGQIYARNQAGADKVVLSEKPQAPAPIVEAPNANIGFGGGQTCEGSSGHTCQKVKEWFTLSMELWPGGTPDGNERIINWFGTSHPKTQTTGEFVTVSGSNKTELCTTASSSNCHWERTIGANGEENQSLEIGSKGRWTPEGGTYRFCKLTMSGGIAELPESSKGVAIYIGGPSCPNEGRGEFSMTSGAQFINNTPGVKFTHNTTLLEIYIYTKTDSAVDTYSNNACNVNGGSSTDATCVLLGQSGDFYGTIFAPYADVLIANTGNVYGAIIGSTVTYNNNNGFYQDEADTEITTATLGSYYRTGWAECRAQATTTNPQSGC
jgi:Tfp pilus assembly protein PilX